MFKRFFKILLILIVFFVPQFSFGFSLFSKKEKQSAFVQGHEIDLEDWIGRVKKNIHKIVLSNGLTVLFYYKQNTPEVFLEVAYNVGAKDEQQHEFGFAHAVEHMIFKGTNKLSENAISEMAKRFCVTDYNAVTSLDKTVYFFDTDKKNWRIFVDVLADCMENVRFDEDQFASEVKAIFREIKSRNGDNSFENVLTELFPVNHVYHHQVFGYKEGLFAADVGQLKEFYKKMYRPDNACLIVVGDLDKDELFQTIENSFGKINSRSNSVVNRQYSLPKSKGFSQKNVTVFKTDCQHEVSCWWRIPGMCDYKNKAYAFFTKTILLKRLAKKLYYEKELVGGIAVSMETFFWEGLFNILFVPREKKSFFSKLFDRVSISKQCIKIIEEEIDSIIKNGVSLDELKLCKKMLNVDFLCVFEDCQSIASMLGDLFLIFQDEIVFGDHILIYQKITSADVKEFAFKYLRPVLMHSFTYLPLPASEEDNWLERQKGIDEYDDEILAQKSRNSFVEDEEFDYIDKFADPEVLDFEFEKPDFEFTLSNGLHVMAKKRVDFPFISGAFRFKNEEDLFLHYELNNKSFVPGFAIELLYEESRGYTKREHEDFFHQLGAFFGTGYFSCLKDDFDIVAERVVHIITKPTYSNYLFKKLVIDSVDSIERRKKDPYFVVSNIAGLRLYKGYSWVKTDAELIKEVRSYRRKDLINFYKQFITPENMFLVIVGNFDESNILNQLEKTFGLWKFSTSAKQLCIDIPKIKNPDSEDISKFFHCEEIILMGYRLTVDRDSSDWLSLMLLEDFLYQQIYKIREKTGLFYSCNSGLIHSSSDRLKGNGFVSVIVSLESKNIAQEALKSVLKDIADNGITESDLAIAKQNFVVSLAKSFTTNDELAQGYADLFSRNKSWDYFDKRIEQVLSVKLDDVNKVAKKYLNPEKWSFICAGRMGEDS